MNKLKINLFGELWKLIKLELSASEYNILEKRATELETPVHEALLDAIFFQDDILPDVFIPTDLKHTCTSGLLDTYKNQIEIWYNGKKIHKMSIKDLTDDYLLFQLYHTKLDNKLAYRDLPKGIYIEQQEIGLVGSYEMIIKHFDIFFLEFNIIQVERNGECFDVLKEIKYLDKILNKKVSDDTLVTRQFSFEI
ncbi:hypothetical protein D3C87_1577200 [compost metagenome]